MRILVIPDTHGRTFWKDVIKTHPIEDFDKVVFLGDYVDPYSSFEPISVEDTIQNFKEIVEFKKQNMDKVVLLLGNHDFYYFFKIPGNSRYSRLRHLDYEEIFEKNRNLFVIAYETDGTLFSHAGYLKGWEDYVNDCIKHYQIDIKLEPTAESLNALLNTKDGEYALNLVSCERGGRYGYGSCIWADVSEHCYNEKYEGKYQVFGHTIQLDLVKYYKTGSYDDIGDGKPRITKKYAMLDCRHGFVYEENDEDRKFFQIEHDGSETQVYMKDYLF